MYIRDLPEEPSGQDLLERKPFAKRVAETIARYPHAAGLVVGIYGVWGEGKSSLLSYMLGAIKELNKSQGDQYRLLHPVQSRATLTCNLFPSPATHRRALSLPIVWNARLN